MRTVRDLRDRYDVLIVGARCAGASLAMLLARAGFSVLAIDRAPYGADTTSTLALMRGGVERLHAWGLVPRVARLAPKIQKTTFSYGERSFEIAIRPRDGVDCLYAPRRSLLDALLVDAAREGGAEVYHRLRLLDVTRARDGRVVGARVADAGGAERVVACSWLVGADGFRSTVARTVSAETRARGRHGSAILYGYFEALGLDGYHWSYAEGFAAGFIPTSDGLTNVFAAAAPGDRAGFLARLERAAPALAPRVRDARQHGRIHAYAATPALLRQGTGPGWALVGDAGAYRDPITAHGMTDALRDAELLARAMARGTDAALLAYERERDERSLEIMDITDRVASYEWRLEELEALHRKLAEAMGRADRNLAPTEPGDAFDREPTELIAASAAP